MRVFFVYMNNECNVGPGAGYVAGALLHAGYEIDFVDTLFTPSADIIKEAITGKYSVFMVSTMTMLFPKAVKLIKAVKEQIDIPVLVGGIHPTIVGASLLEDHPEIDYLCVGEGESFVIDFMSNLGSEKLYSVPNLVYRLGKKIVSNSSRPPEDLSKIPSFPWHFFPDKAVVQDTQGFLYVNASRGCPYDCSYCCNGIYLKNYGRDYLRIRPANDVLNELKYLRHRYQPTLFYFGDEMLLSKPSYAKELFAGIRSQLNMPFGCMVRVEYLKPEMAEFMAHCGCQYIAMGVECGNEEFRRKVLNRTMSNRQIERAFSAARQAGIFTTSFNMIGYPTEEDAGLTQDTIQLNERIKPNYAQFSIFFPFPGTRLHTECLNNDLVDPDKLSETNNYFEESVLRGVSLKKDLKSINSRFNPKGFQFKPNRISLPASLPGQVKVLMLTTDHLILDRRIMQQAQSLVNAEYSVKVIGGLECPTEAHYFENGVEVQRLSFQGPTDALGPSLPARVIKHLIKKFLNEPNYSEATGRFGRNEDQFLNSLARVRSYVRNVLAPLIPRMGPKLVERFLLLNVRDEFFDVVHVHDLPLLNVGARLARKWGAKLVYDAHEIFYVNHSFSPKMRQKMQSRERKVASRVDLFTTVNSALANYFQNEYRREVKVLLNCAPSTALQPGRDYRGELRTRAGLASTERVVLYQGWFSSERNLESLVQAGAFLPEGVSILLIGYGEHEAKLKSLLGDKGWAKKVKFLGRIESEELSACTAGADVGVIPYLPVDINHENCSPNKFFEYVQAGVPVIAHDLVFFRNMQKKYGVVLTGDLSTPEGMAKTLRLALDSPEQLKEIRKACDTAARILCWEVEEKKLLTAYREMNISN